MQLTGNKKSYSAKNANAKQQQVEIKAAGNAIPSPAPVSHQKIAERAFLLWQHRGCLHGCDQNDWFTAERELTSLLSKRN